MLAHKKSNGASSAHDEFHVKKFNLDICIVVFNSNVKNIHKMLAYDENNGSI